jgi:benzoyl-CoA-dihydrodiol lyase
MGATSTDFKIGSFETHPDRYRHWKLTVDGDVATLAMNVEEHGGLAPDYPLKLNSYDLGVDIELADGIQRLRFEHPHVRAVVITSLRDGIFCAGANIFMLGMSSHPFKVNFCKFTNETRLAIEDASTHAGLKSLAALNGTASGGGYELALACDEIVLIDDGNSAVSLPEVPLLGVLPGTGGLTRLVDKRKVRRDRADFFCTLAEGVRGKRAVQWHLVDDVIARSKWSEGVRARAKFLAENAGAPRSSKGVKLLPLEVSVTENQLRYKYVTLTLDRRRHMAELVVLGPMSNEPLTPEAMLSAGCQLWALRAFRELDDALLRLRFVYMDIGTVAIKTVGEALNIRAVDEALYQNRQHWFVSEVVQFMKRTLKRLDCTGRSLIALVEEGSCFVGSLLELALASDRTYALADPQEQVALGVTALNNGPLPMANGLTRLQTRFLGTPQHVEHVFAQKGSIPSSRAEGLGLVFAAPDNIDYADEVRLCLEERAAMSADALTAMEANLRFAGPETLETKIFGRLSAWQNWIFTRPNATGEKGALTLYGKPARPEFDQRRC